MPRNSTFHFKQFSVQQDQCGMKVCTDACILGAWAEMKGAKRILDIGTGTGLLALMLAQRHPEAQIDAVEIDPKAVQQAQENVKNSPFSKQIRVFNTAIQHFQSNQKYDLIVSNPPFFQDSLRSPSPKINQAHHAETLTLEELATAVRQFLNPNGYFVVLLPPHEMQLFEKLGKQNDLSLSEKLLVQHRESKGILREIASFSFSPNALNQRVLVIYDEQQVYTKNFRDLLQNYYLAF